MNEHELIALRIECSMFFRENPYAFETEESLALRTGRNIEHLKPVLHELVGSSILQRIGDGDQAIYRYAEPYYADGIEV